MMSDSLVAITRAVPASINRCELTFHTRVPIDVPRARLQHAEYQRILMILGCDVIELPEMPEQADSVFVEDAAVVFNECAVITRPGAASRRAETPSIREALEPYRTLHEISAPGTLDGGDVLRIGRRTFVGVSTRTNREAIDQLRTILAPHGHEVIAVEVKGALHLKSVATAISDDLIVIDAQQIDPAVFGTRYIAVPADAANMLRVNDTILCPIAAEQFVPRLEAEGWKVRLVANSELAKAEAALTCCSLVFEAHR